MREFNENILESLDDGLVVFDADERIVRWNRALEGFYGVTRAEAIGRPLGDVFDAPFVEALRAARARESGRRDAVPGAADRPRDRRRTTGRGCWSTPRRCRCRARRTPTRSSGRFCCIEDITDRVRLEEQLQISEKMASIGLLAAGVAHEVNTPLTGISSFTQMLLEGADPADPKTVLLEKIERQTFRAAKIVNGLLNLSRPGHAGERTDRRRPQRRHHRRVLAARASVRGRQHQGAARAVAGAGHGARHRAPAAAGVPEPVPERARRDAERRLAVGDDAGRRRSGRSPRSPTPGRAFRPSSWRASTIRSSPPRRSAAAPASACRSPTASCASTTARFAATAPSARARGSRWRCRSRAGRGAQRARAES